MLEIFSNHGKADFSVLHWALWWKWKISCFLSLFKSRKVGVPLLPLPHSSRELSGGWGWRWWIFASRSPAGWDACCDWGTELSLASCPWALPIYVCVCVVGRGRGARSQSTVWRINFAVERCLGLENLLKCFHKCYIRSSVVCVRSFFFLIKGLEGTSGRDRAVLSFPDVTNAWTHKSVAKWRAEHLASLPILQACRKD